MAEDIDHFDDRVRRVLPWVLDLPRDERRTVFTDLLGVVDGGRDTGMSEAELIEMILQDLVAWKATSEVYTDPEALKAFTTPLEVEDLVEVPRPGEDWTLTVVPASHPVLGPCEGKHPDTWFDRSVCAEPCGSMHDRCTVCGFATGHCPFEAEPPARLLGCGLCYEEDGQEIHPHPECTWITPRYKNGSVITQGMGSGSRRWEVTDVLEQKYRVRALFSGFTDGQLEPTFSIWEFGLCHGATVLEWQKDEPEGVIDALGRSRVPKPYECSACGGDDPVGCLFCKARVSVKEKPGG